MYFKPFHQPWWGGNCVASKKALSVFCPACCTSWTIKSLDYLEFFILHSSWPIKLRLVLISVFQLERFTFSNCSADHCHWYWKWWGTQNLNKGGIFLRGCLPRWQLSKKGYASLWRILFLIPVMCTGHEVKEFSTVEYRCWKKTDRGFNQFLTLSKIL